MIGIVKKLIPQMLELDQTKEYEVKEWKKKRSLDANSYYWVLVGKIADVLRADKDSIHLQMLKQYGQRTPVLLAQEIDARGYFKYYEYKSTIKKNERLYNEYMVYKGSSEMSSKEMAVLIDGVVYEAQELDINTLTPSQIADLKSQWNKEE